ncbi:MAG: hypothetical protein ABSC73_09580 [Acidimicrobiales bacterium]|jgi:hypothetical protein
MKTLVYGVVDDNLVILPEEVAVAYASDREAIFALKTFGEAIHFKPKAGNYAPGADDWEDYFEERPADDEPYDAAAFLEQWPEYEWPPAAATIALEEMPEDLDDIGEQVEDFPFVPTLQVSPELEAQIVSTIRGRGYEIRRDDELIWRV